MAFPQKLETKTVVGSLIWIAAIAALAMLIRNQITEDSLTDRLSGYFGKQQRTVEFFSPENQMLGFGDPVFSIDENGVNRVGNISHIDFGKGYEDFRIGDTKVAMATLYGNAPALSAGDYLKVYETDQSMEWVIRTMLPPDMRERIGDLITNAWQSNQDELVAMFRPLIEESIADAGKIIQEDLKVSIQNHRDQIDSLSQRYREQLLEKEIIPLVRKEIWPIVQEEAQPLTEAIGQEIWQEVSVWRFGWRYIYDRSPLPEKKLTEKEFNRFVESKAIPILENHLEDFIDVQKSMLTRISGNEKVKETFSKSVRDIANDPQFRDLVTSIIKEVLVDNPRLRDALKNKWQSPQARLAMTIANKRLDPTVTEIGATLFGSTKTEITPEFARVLRNKVLHKDERWLTLHTKAAGNRDEELAQQIIEASEESSTINRLPMFTELESSEYPTVTSPTPKESVVTRADQE
jgi:hypothetical protein